MGRLALGGYGNMRDRVGGEWMGDTKRVDWKGGGISKPGRNLV